MAADQTDRPPQTDVPTEILRQIDIHHPAHHTDRLTICLSSLSHSYITIKTELKFIQKEKN